MAGEQDLVVETVRDILNGFEPFVLTAERRWDAGLWGALAEAGLTGVGLPEEAGGSGGELADAVAIVRTLAAGAAAVPVAEQLLVAGPALVAADLTLPSPEEPLTFAVADAVTVHPVDNGDGPGRFTLNGTVTDVAWAGVAAHVAVLAPAPAGLDGSLLALVDAVGPRGDRRVQPGRGAARLAGAGPGAGGGRAADRGAGRGAAGSVRAGAGGAAGRGARAGAGVDRAVRGGAAPVRPAAGQVPGDPDGAGRDGRRGDRGDGADRRRRPVAGPRRADFVLAAAAAKVRAGAAVEVVARLAHQVHGAIGFTQEHKLHHLTRRCWAWRDEAGSELVWSRVLGERTAGRRRGRVLAGAHPGGLSRDLASWVRWPTSRCST